MKNVLKLLTKSVIIPLGLIAAGSAIDELYKNNFLNRLRQH